MRYERQQHNPITITVDLSIKYRVILAFGNDLLNIRITTCGFATNTEVEHWLSFPKISEPQEAIETAGRCRCIEICDNCKEIDDPSQE